MFLHLGENILVCTKDIIAILDIKSTLYSKYSKEFLKVCEEEGFINKTRVDKPRSIVVTEILENKTVRKIKVYYSPISAVTLQKRANFVKENLV